MDQFEQHLTLKESNLKTLPLKLLQESQYESIDIVCKNLEIINEEILYLKKLKRISITGPKNLKLSPLIFKLPNLEYIYLKNIDLNNMEEVSPNLNLKKISLSNCELDRIPDFICYGENITELSLMGNKIQNIPAIIENMSSLKRINLDFNLLKSLPIEFYKIKTIKHLGLDHNPFNEEERLRIENHYNIKITNQRRY